MKKGIISIVLLCLAGCSSTNSKESVGSYTNNKQEVATAKVKWEEDTIKEVELDETTKDTTKKQLGASYNMKEASSIGKEWFEQIQFLEKYIEQHGIDNLQLNEEGKSQNPDVLSGCTISIDPFVKAIEDASSKASDMLKQ